MAMRVSGRNTASAKLRLILRPAGDASPRTAGGDLVECIKHMRAVAAEYGYAPEAIRISIEVDDDLVAHF